MFITKKKHIQEIERLKREQDGKIAHLRRENDEERKMLDNILSQYLNTKYTVDNKKVRFGMQTSFDQEMVYRLLAPGDNSEVYYIARHIASLIEAELRTINFSRFEEI